MTRNEDVRHIPLNVYAILAFVQLGTIGFSNARYVTTNKITVNKVYFNITLLQIFHILFHFCHFSLQYLNYPTQVIFKSCKLIPVLIGGILIQRKRKGILDFLAAIVMSIGLAVFVLADSQVSVKKHFKFI